MKLTEQVSLICLVSLQFFGASWQSFCNNKIQDIIYIEVIYMLLRTGEQIENDLFHIFETIELDYEEVEKE